MTSVGIINFKKAVQLFFSDYWFATIMFLLTIIYLFFPNNNHLVDSLSYGASVKYSVDLFSPHHLLFSYCNFIVFRCVSFIFPAIDALKLMQFTNGVFALLCLFLLRKIILKQTIDVVKANIWTCFVGCSFGVMRFAAEAETYIIPIFFSLLSSYYFLNYLQTKQGKNIFYSGLFASVACLFHQIHLFWGIGLFIGLLTTKKIKPIFFFLLSTPIVILAYSLVLVYYNHIQFNITNLFHFLAEYYFSDKADMHIGMSNLVITIITFFRTYFQVHGIILEVLKLMPVFYLLLPIVGFLLSYSIIKVIKTIKLKEINRFHEVPFELTHLFIFILQFGFAFYSHGNSEFMVMLPFIIAIFIHLFVDFDLIALKSFTAAMLIWNFAFAIFPNNTIDYQNNRALLTIIKNNPDKVFILKEKNSIVNQYFYEFGTQEGSRLIENENKSEIKKLKNMKVIIYTDVLTKRVPYNRVDFTSKSNYTNLLFVRHISRIESALGTFYIDEVKSLD